jgi:hypothetical protein
VPHGAVLREVQHVPDGASLRAGLRAGVPGLAGSVPVEAPVVFSPVLQVKFRIVLR